MRTNEPANVDINNDAIINDGLKILSHIIARRHMALTRQAGIASHLSKPDDKIRDNEGNHNAGTQT